jgi:2-phosphoglycerate kinase
VARAIREKKSTVIEGIHLIPGHMDFLQKYARQATFIPIMVDIRSKASHHERFMSRGAQNSKRPQTRYLKFFKEIRLIRDYLIRQAERKSVPVVENYDLRHAEREILDHIFNHYQKNKKS